MKLTLIIISTIVLLVAGFISYKIIKWRDSNECDTPEARELRQQIEIFNAKIKDDEQKINKLQQDYNNYQNYQDQAGNLLFALDRVKPSKNYSM